MQRAATGEVLIGHAGVRNDLVRTELTPAPQGITIKSQGGNTLAISRNIRNGSIKADLFGAAEANANQLLTGDANGNKVRWFATFVRNAIVVLYSPNSRYLAEFYYALLVAQLAEKFSGEVGLKQLISGDDRSGQRQRLFPGPLLFGGDLAAVPEKLQRYIEGVFTQTALVVAPPSPAVAGTVTTLTATVTPAAAGGVQFKDGDNPLGKPVTVANGIASMTTRLPMGPTC
ncbi:MAG: hypothetical protein ACRDRX_27785 [Pseudonocardiaceae bacterium]